MTIYKNRFRLNNGLVGYLGHFDFPFNTEQVLDNNKSVHGRFNCITVKYNGTGHGIYIISEVHYQVEVQIGTREVA